MTMHKNQSRTLAWRAATALCIMSAWTCPAMAGSSVCANGLLPDFSTECDLGLKNGDFTMTGRIGSSRAIRWTHLVHWEGTHRRHNYAGEYAGRWGAELHADGHALWQAVAAIPSLDSRSHFIVRYSAGAFDTDGSRLQVIVMLLDATGKVIQARDEVVVPASRTWGHHVLRWEVPSVPEGAQVKLAFRRQGNDGGKRLVVSAVSIAQGKTHE